MYDTVVVKSPPIDIETKEKLLNFCRIYQSIDYCDGELFYCFYSGALDGSYDYRIRMAIDNREWVKPEGALTPVAIEGDWFVKVECSVHKLLNNHNVFGGPRDIKKAIAYLIRFIEEKANVNMPCYGNWEAERIDVSKIFVFTSPDICKRVVQNLCNGAYGRRKMRPYENGVMFSGSTTTDKFYWKGPEFEAHDFKRFNKYIAKEIDVNWQKDNYDRIEQKLIHLKWQMDKVLERAMRTIRFEVEVKPRKLKDLFCAEGEEKVLVSKLDDVKLHNVMESELKKCVKENENMDVIRRSDLVAETLNKMYKPQLANCLYSVWAKLVQFGERQVKDELPKSTFLRYKKQLLDAGVSWMVTNVNLRQVSIVPDDFSFLSSAYVDDSVAVEVEEKLRDIA